MAENQPSPQGRKRRRTGRRSPKRRAASRTSDTDRRLAWAKKIYHLLLELHRDLFPDGNFDRSSVPKESESRVEGAAGAEEAILIRFAPKGNAGRFARELVEALLASGGRREDSSPFVEGCVYCHHCDSAYCLHAPPPSHLHVFAGYTPTGFPLWEEFFTVVLDARDPRIDDLLQENPGIVGVYQDRRSLQEKQLQIFGKYSGRYDVLGQVVTGYLPLPRGGNDARAAVTLQAVRCQGPKGSELRLNVIGKLPGGKGIIDHLKIEPEPELEGLFAVARKKLESLGRRMRPPSDRDASDPAQGAVNPVLTQLARGIERTFRRRRRRTRHAMERSSERPAVGLALKDLEKASADRLLFDELHHTFIVVGPKWRIHVFGRDGRHVTSMYLDRERVQKRIDLRRWRYATPHEISDFRSEVAGRDSRSA